MNGKTKNVIASLCAVAALAFAGIGGYMVGQRLRSRYYRGQHNSHQNSRGPTGAGCRLKRRAIE